jgi:hypothetical protein
MTKNTMAGFLNLAVESAQALIPIDLSPWEAVKTILPKEISLWAFVAEKKGEELVGGGPPDCQALLAAYLIELRLKKDKEGRKVAVVRDPKDGHAVVYYRHKDGGISKFDPTAGDTNFKEVKEPADEES